MIATAVRTTHLELTGPDQLVPARRPPGDIDVVRATIASPEFSRFLYTAVGSDHYWRDRLAWTHEEWQTLLERPDYETWYLTVSGTPAGYAELDARHPPSVEIAYFGLLPAFIGHGHGGWLLDCAVRRGFEIASRVWLHTCTLDGPSALPAYLRRGFRSFKVEEHVTHLPEAPLSPWPGARRERRAG